MRIRNFNSNYREIFKNISLVALAILLNFCTQEEKGKQKSIISRVLIDTIPDKICELKEDAYLIGRGVSEIEFDNDSIFYIPTEKEIIRYNLSGYQLSKIGTTGEGFMEYLAPDKMFISKQYIYVWCKMLLKLLIFNKDGEIILDKKLTTSAIKDFVVYNDEIACFLLTGSIGDKKIEIYDIKSEKLLRTIKNKNNENKLLSIANQAGGITVLNDSLYWVYPSEIKIYSLSLQNIEEEVSIGANYMDDDFIVENLNDRAEDIVNNNLAKVIRFINTNGRVIQLFSNNSNLFLVAETGKTVFKNDKLDFSERKIKIYKFHSKDSIVNSFVFNYPENCGLVSGVNDHLYILTGEETGDSLVVYLNSYIIPSNGN